MTFLETTVALSWGVGRVWRAAIAAADAKAQRCYSLLFDSAVVVKNDFDVAAAAVAASPLPDPLASASGLH